MSRYVQRAQAIVDRANDLARIFYGCMGCSVPDGYRFDKATHPQERLCWACAVEAMCELRGEDVEDALSIVEDEAEAA